MIVITLPKVDFGLRPSASCRCLKILTVPFSLAAVLCAALLVSPICAYAEVGERQSVAASDSTHRQVQVDDGISLVASVDDEGVLRVEGVVVERATTTPTAEDDAGLEITVLSPSEAADIIDLQSEEVLVALAAIREGWYQSATGDWLYFENGSYVTGWRKIDGYWYSFAITGVMRTGWYSDGTYWFYLRPSNGVPTSGPQGSMVTGWGYIDGSWYSFDSDGAMRRGWYYAGGEWYYFASNGAMQTGWVKDGSKWFYTGTDGAMLTGWQFIGSHWYYLADNKVGAATGSSDYGEMLKGLWEIDLYEYYFFDPSSDMMQLGLKYPEGAMVRDVSYAEFMGSNGIIVYGVIDEFGHVFRHTILSLEENA